MPRTRLPRQDGVGTLTTTARLPACPGRLGGQAKWPCDVGIVAGVSWAVPGASQRMLLWYLGFVFVQVVVFSLCASPRSGHRAPY